MIGEEFRRQGSAEEGDEVRNGIGDVKAQTVAGTYRAPPITGPLQLAQLNVTGPNLYVSLHRRVRMPRTC